MRKKTCPWDDKVTRSLSKKQIDPEVEKHVAECPVCEEIRLIHGWMNRYKRAAWEREAAEKKLPGAEEMWTRLQSVRKRDKKFVSRALRPVVLSQFFAAAALVVSGVVFMLANLPRLRSLLYSEPVAGSLLQSFSVVVKTAPSWLPLVFIPMVIVLVSMGFISLVTSFEDRKHRPT